MLFPFCTLSAQNNLKSFDDDSDYTESTSTYKRASGSYFSNNFIPTFNTGYGFVDSDGFSYEATIGVNYEFIPNLYVGARIGYLGGGYSSSYNEYGYNASFDASMHFLSIPLELGYIAVTENKFGIVPFVGLGVNIGLSGEAETKISGYGSEKIDLELGGELGIDARAGLRLMLAGWTISGTYHFPLNDNQKDFFGDDAYPELSIGWYLFD